MVSLWREWVEEKGGPDLDGLLANLNDQRAFAKVARKLIKDLELVDEEDGDLDDER